MPSSDKNVLGGTLAPCSISPRTGFYRDGCCNTGPEDLGLHIVCTEVTEAFLREQRDFCLTKWEKRLPFRESIDGAFVARFERM